MGKLFDGIKQRARFARAAGQDWKPVALWLATFAVLYALPYLWSSGADRVQWQGMFFQWAGVIVVAWGLAETRRNLFGKPPLLKALTERFRRISYIFKPPPPITASMAAVEAGDAFMSAHAIVRKSVTGDVDARIAALAENQRRMDQETAEQRKLTERLTAELGQRIDAEQRERSDGEKRMRTLVEGAVIGGIHLEVAGVAFLLIGIAFTSIPNWIAEWLR